MMRLAMYSVMRRGELFSLKWSDVDFQRGYIHLRAPSGVDQTIPMNGEARKVLERHPRTRSEFVFPGRFGGFRPFHGLKHTFASMLASSGEFDLYTLQKLSYCAVPGDPESV